MPVALQSAEKIGEVFARIRKGVLEFDASMVVRDDLVPGAAFCSSQRTPHDPAVEVHGAVVTTETECISPVDREMAGC